MASKAANKRNSSGSTAGSSVSSSHSASSSSSSTPATSVEGEEGPGMRPSKDYRLSDPPPAIDVQSARKRGGGTYVVPRVPEQTGSMLPNCSSAMQTDPHVAGSPLSLEPASLPVVVPPRTRFPNGILNLPRAPSAPSALPGEGKEEAKMDVDSTLAVNPVLAPSPPAAAEEAQQQVDPDVSVNAATDRAAKSMKSMHVGADKLMAEANIDARSSTDFKLRVAVDPRDPDFKPVDFAVFSNRNSNRDLAGFRALINLLGASDQLAIHAPRVPRALVGLTTDRSNAEASSDLSPGQRDWLTKLRQYMKDHGTNILSGHGNKKQRYAICNDVVTFLSSASNSINATTLAPWEDHELTHQWSDLLMQGTTVKRFSPDDDDIATPPPRGAKQRGRGKAEKSKSTNPYFYMLHMRCAGREVAFIIACVLTRYALTATEGWVRPLTDEYMQLLDGLSEPVDPADPTDPEDSDSDDPRANRWLKVKSKPKRSLSRYEHRRRVSSRFVAATKQLRKKSEFQNIFELLEQETTRPLLLLSTHMFPPQAWVTRYVSIQVDNLHTICDMRSAAALQNDLRFKQLNTIPQLAAPNAFWKVTQTATGVQTALWIREDMVTSEILPQIPQLIQAKLKLTTLPPLTFRGTFWATTRAGRIISNSSVTVAANENVKILPPTPWTQSLPALYQPPPTTAATSPAGTARRIPTPPEKGSWAGRVYNAALVSFNKRTANTPSLNHHPRKEQRLVPAAAPSGPPPRNQLPTAPQQPVASSHSHPQSAPSPSLPSSSRAHSQRGPQPASTAAALAPIPPTAFTSLMTSMQEQREQFAAWKTSMEKDTTAFRDQLGKALAQMNEDFNAKIKTLQDLVTETINANATLTATVMQLTSLVTPHIGRMQTSSAPFPRLTQNTHTTMPGPPHGNTPSVQLASQDLMQPQGQQQSSPTNRNALANPAHDDLGMAVHDE
jgi:hypothetical protein